MAMPTLVATPCPSGPVVVRPDWVLRIEPHHPVPDCVHQRRERHRRPRMSGLGLLDGVDGKRANCVNAQLIDFGVRDWFSYLCGTHILISYCNVFIDGLAALRARQPCAAALRGLLPAPTCRP